MTRLKAFSYFIHFHTLFGKIVEVKIPSRKKLSLYLTLKDASWNDTKNIVGFIKTSNQPSTNANEGYLHF